MSWSLETVAHKLVKLWLIAQFLLGGWIMLTAGIGTTVMSVMFVVYPLALREGCQGKACLCLYCPQVSKVGLLGEGLFCHCVVCLAVKQGEPPEKAMPPCTPHPPSSLHLSYSFPTSPHFTIQVMVCSLFISLTP